MEIFLRYVGMSYWLLMLGLVLCMSEVVMVPMQIERHWSTNKISNSYLVGLSG
jgi:hypothetical protein